MKRLRQPVTRGADVAAQAIRDWPGWPPVLDDHLAAAYLGGMSVTTFRTQVAPSIPKVQITVRLVGWLRTDLDAWLAARPREGAPSPLPNPWKLDPD